MNYVVVMLLSFMDEESAYIVFSFIVTKILPKNFYSKTTQGSSLMGFHREKFILWSLAKDHLHLDEGTAAKVKDFLDMRSPGFLIPLFVNYLNFQTLVATWGQMIKKQSVNNLLKAVYLLIR